MAHILKKKYVLLLIISIPYIFNHLSFFLFFPVPEFSRDSFDYWRPVLDILHSRAPLFNIRTPGYSIFLFIANIFNSALAALVLQALFCWLAAFVVLNLFAKHYREFFLPAGLSLAIFLNSPRVLYYNTSFFAESVYTSLLILVVGYFIVAFVTNKNNLWIAFSALSGMLIITRPQAVVFLAILAIIAVFKFKSLTLRNALSILLPVSLISIALLSYNLATFGRFTFTDLTFLNNLGSSITYVETDNKYPEGINNIIIEFNQKVINNKKEDIENTWNINDLSKEFSKWDSCFILTDRINNAITGDAQGTYYKPENIAKFSGIINKISIDSKRKNPALYMRFIYTSFVVYNISLSKNFYFFYTNILNRAKWIQNTKEMYITNQPKDLSEITFKEYEGVTLGENLPPYLATLNNKNFYNEMDKLPAMVRISNYYEMIYNALFRNGFWIFAFWIVYLYTIVKVLAGKLKDQYFNILFIVSNYLVLSILIVSIFQFPIMRLSYPTEFLYYLVPLLFTIYITNKTRFKYYFKND